MGKNQKFNAKNTKDKESKGKKKWSKGKAHIRAEHDTREEDTYSTNDISWYAHYPELMRDAASINWNTLMGVPIPENLEISRMTGAIDWNSLTRDEFSPAGLALVKVSPTFGYANDELDPINVAATQGYGNIRTANSGSTNYNATDWMIHMLGVADCYSIVSYMIRLYSLFRVYNVQNKYWPKAIIEAEGFSVAQLNREAANFRFAINALIPKISSIAVPAVFDIFRRRAYMFQNVYTEGDVVKDQLYMFEPASFLSFELDSSGAGKLTSYEFDTKVPRGGSGYRDIWDLVAWAEDMTSHFFGDESTGTITGDILKAFGDNIIKLAPIPEDLFVSPVKDYVVLEQIHNATVISNLNPGSLDVVQLPLVGNNGILVHTPTLGAIPVPGLTNPDYGRMYYASLFTDENHLLTVNAPDPGPDLNMEITRLHSVIFTDANGSWAVKSGSEIVRGIDIITLFSSGTYPTTFMPVIAIDDDPAASLDRFENLVMNREFHYLPLQWVTLTVPGNTPSDPPIVLYRGRSIELTNWTMTRGDVIDRLHYTALSSMVYIQPNAFYKNVRR